MKDGKKVYIDEKELQEDDGKEPAPAPVTPPADEPSDEDEDVQKTADQIAKMVSKKLGLDDLQETIKQAHSIMSRPENAKLREILHGKDVANKDQLTKEEKIVGFFHALVTRNEAAVKALAEGTNADGGYLFPAEFAAELVRPLANFPRMRSLVRVVTMRRNSMLVSSVANRPKVYWTAENAAKTTTTAAFGQATLTAKKAAAIIYSSDELIEDSTEFDVVSLIIDLFSEAIGEEEDRVILRGNGTTEPTGIETARAAGTIASVTNVGNLSFDNLITLVYALKAKYRAGATFLVHPTNVAELRKLKDTNGRYLWVDPVPGTGVTVERPASILGYPVVEAYDAPEATIYFGNWKLAYWLGDRKQMTVKISNDTETAFTKDQTAIRVVFRIGGLVVLGEAAKALISIP